MRPFRTLATTCRDVIPDVRQSMVPSVDDGPSLSGRAGSRSLVLSLKNIYETLAISVPTMIDAFRGRITKDLCDRRLAVWANHIVVDNGRFDLEVLGRENLRPGETYLVMS